MRSNWDEILQNEITETQTRFSTKQSFILSFPFS